MLGGLLAIRIRPVRPLLGGAVAMFAFPMMPLAAAPVPGLPLLMPGYAVSGAGRAFWGVQWSTTVQTRIPQDRLNRVTAYEVGGSILAIPFGQVLSGPASGLFGVRPLLLAGAAISLGCALALVLVRPIRTPVRRDTGASPRAAGDGGS